MKGLKTYRLTAAAVALACISSVSAADLYMSWTCILDGSLDQGAFGQISGSTVIGGNTIHDISGDFFFPNGIVGNGTGKAIGTITITCDIVAPEGVFIHDVSIFDIGQIIPGVHATTPWYAWTELILDITDPDNPVTLISDSGVEYSLPQQRYYQFTPTRFLRIKEVYTLDGVTYTDDFGNTVIDDTAMVALVQIQKDLSLVPEPSSLAGLGAGFVGLAAMLRRRR